MDYLELYCRNKHFKRYVDKHCAMYGGNVDAALKKKTVQDVGDYYMKERNETMETIKIKYHVDDMEKIEKIQKGDWIDLRAAEDVFIPKNEYRLISLGVSMELPEGYEAHIVPRSSTFKNFGIILVNSMGIIDNTYCGDDDIWRFPAFCLQPNDFQNGVAGSLIKKNDRICQFRIVKNQPEICFERVYSMKNESRGGIGSTGIN